MHPSPTVITLGVSDLSRARAFYCQGLGFVASSAGNEHIVFLKTSGVVLALYSRTALAEDACLPSAPVGNGFSGVTLARNLGSPAEVDAFLEQARRAGAKILKPAQKVFWGGYSGYFADPDGHAWEVAHNPFWKLGVTGLLELPD